MKIVPAQLGICGFFTSSKRCFFIRVSILEEIWYIIQGAEYYVRAIFVVKIPMLKLTVFLRLFEERR